MKAIKNLGILVLLVPVVFSACELEEGDPNLAGNWTCKETSEIYMKSTKGTSIFTVTFARDAVNPDKYYIGNFYKLGNSVDVVVIKEGYSISLPQQSVNGFVFAGNGTINESFDLINMTYTADDGGGEIDHVTAELTR